MLFGLLTLITALTISAVAIYYSVAGLVAIFAAAPIPIIIMGSVLEIGKLVTAVWLHKYWHHAVWWLKAYLSIAVLVLMLITSMGIFGFLSSAHIEQTATASENVAKIEQIDEQILNEEEIVKRAEASIAQLESSGSTQDEQIQQQIDREQARIDTAYSRVQPAIDEQNEIIIKEETRLGTDVNLYKDLITTIDKNLTSIEQNIASGNIEAVQALVGVEADGNLGPATERAIESFRSAQNSEKQRLTDLITTNSKNITSTVIDAARVEIQRQRSLAEAEVASSNELISRLRQQLGTVDVEEQSRLITEQRQTIQSTRVRLETLTQEKFELETSYRKLEAEVGPVKYLAEFIYGTTADSDLLEEAVRWVIVIIIFVFDPLAVLLLIASQYTFEINSRNKKETISNNEEEKNELPNPTDVERPITVNDSGPDSNFPAFHSQRSFIKVPDEDDRAGDNGRDITETLARVEPITKEEELRELEYLAKEQQEDFNNDKESWKHDHPDQTLKKYKTLFIQGKIDNLPWEGYTDYKQNEEQNENSLFQKLRNNDNN